ncbi:hypothetical protein BJY52DRAFT_1257588 [Lactarius psammicola]|nr:hypothetical protein BJY52DRAFT_1257588 [Lactarius psammicola]
MPGPQNAKKKKRAQQKKHHARIHSSIAAQRVHPASPDLSSSTLVTLPSPTIAAQEADEVETLCPDPHVKPSGHENSSPSFHGTPYGPPDDPTLVLLSNPIIVNHGNGPRVRDMRAFLHSWFAQPAWTADPLCAEFAQREILQMLCTVLPEETALCLWYNKSRRFGRVCPACLRPYSLADAPPDAPTLLLSEQIISGLCSPICFFLASSCTPAIAEVTLGRMAEDLEDATWELLDRAGPTRSVKEEVGVEASVASVGLTMLLKMTRLHDLGLAQLCIPELVIDEDVHPTQTRQDQGKFEREGVCAYVNKVCCNVPQCVS